MMLLLLLCILVCILKHVGSKIALKVSSLLVHPECDEVLSRISAIRSEMEGISITEEFSKYAKLQRQLNKCLEERKKNEVERVGHLRAKYRKRVLHLVQGFTTVLCIYLIWNYGSTPVILLNPNWTNPLTPLLAWPSSIPGALSVHVWLLICNSVIGRIKSVKLNLGSPIPFRFIK